MKEITMEKLLTDLKGVVDDFNQLVNNGDIEGVKKALAEVEYLIKNAKNIQLDHPNYPQSDHVLHELLKNLGGVVKSAPQLPESQKKILITELIKHETYITEVSEIHETWRNCGRYKSVSSIDRRIKEIEEERKKFKKGSEEYKTISRELEFLSKRREILVQREKIKNIETTMGTLDIVAEESEYLRLKQKHEHTEKKKIFKPDGTVEQEEIHDLSETDLEYYKFELLEMYYQAGKDLKTAQEKRKKEGLTLRRTIRDKKTKITNIKIELGETPDREAEEYNVDEEVRRIGDAIFGTAIIRTEATNRISEGKLTRENYIAFYQEGRERAIENAKKLTEEAKKIVQEVQDLFCDPDSEKTLREQADEAKLINDEEKLKSIYEKIRLRMIEKGYGKTHTILNTEITNPEQIAQFGSFLDEYRNQINTQIVSIKNNINEQKENIEIFEDEIAIIKEEQQAIELSNQIRTQYAAERDYEIQLRDEQISASLLGASPEMRKEWNERFERYYSHRTKNSITYKDANNKEQKIEYDTIADYKEMKEDAQYLNLQKYKNYLEATSIYKNSNGNMSLLSPEIRKELQEAEEKEPGGAEKHLEEMQLYVDTFHGHTNKYKVKYDTYKTAGSTLKAMVPVKNLTPAKKAATVTSNFFRFFGIRKPEFTRINEKGERVKDIKGGVTVLATDALVIGGTIATGVIGGPWALAALGTAYAAKGVVTLGNLAAAGIVKRRHAYDIEHNIPTTMEEEPDKKEQEVARRDYYRQEEKNNRFTSWVKAKSDRYFRTKRGNETLKKIIAKRQAESRLVINENYKQALQSIDHNLEQAGKNQQTRNENQRIGVLSQEAYNDMVSNPNAANINEWESNIAQNALLRSRGKTGRNINENPSNQYVKDSEPLGRTEKLKDVTVRDDSVANVAITEEQRRRARKEKQDNRNRVATIILSMAGKLGLDYIRNGFTSQVTEQIPAEYRKEEIMTTQESVPENVTDLKVETSRLNDVYTQQSSTMNPGDVLLTGQSETLNDVGAAALQYVDQDGKEIVISIAEKGLGYSTRHVQKLIAANMSNMSPTEIISALQQSSPSKFNHIIESLGLEGQSMDQITKTFIEKGIVSLQNKSMGGWTKVLGDKANIITEVIGTGEFRDVLVKPAETIIRTIFNPKNIAKAAGIGTAAGVAVTTADAVHEVAHPTETVTPGTFEQRTPNISDYFTKITRKGQEEINANRNNDVNNKEIEAENER